MFANRYNMTIEENIFFAKRNIVDTIWKEARLEGIAVTFPDTQMIYDGRTAAGLTLDQTKAINNLKHAWEFILANIRANIDVFFVRQLHKIIGGDNLIYYAGELRQSNVTIGGTKWTPALPTYDNVVATLSALNEIKDPVDRALETLAVAAKGQWFSDGNKRLAQLLSNKILIEQGRGVLAVAPEDISTFLSNLIDYYETDNSEKLKLFLYDNALTGADYSLDRQRLPERD